MRGATPVGEREGVLAGQGRAPSPCPLAKPACSISHAALVLTVPSVLRPARRVGGQPGRLRRREQRVGEERAGAPGVVVGRRRAPSPCRGAAPSTASRTSASGARWPTSTPRVRASSAYRDRGAEAAVGELEGDLEDDVAAGLGLEPAGAVAEAAVGHGEGPLGAVDAVPGAHRRDRVGDLLAVGADVLDRGRADRPRGCRRAPRRRPSPRPPRGRPGRPSARRRRPGPARRRRGRRRRSRRRSRPRGWPRGPPCPGKPSSATTRLLPPPSTQHRGAGGVGVGHRADQVRLGGGLHPGGGGAAEPERGVLAQQLRHAPLPWACRAPSDRRRSPRARSSRGRRRRP